MTNSPIPLWIDCDPGNDDAVAIMLSIFDDQFDLIGVSTVHGNTTIENATYNALALLTAMGLNTPIYQGYGVPIKAEAKTAHHIHGTKGLGGWDLLPVPTISTVGGPEKFEQDLATAIEKYDGELSIVAIGPLTNVAVFFSKYPQLREKIKFISIMGGAVSERTWNIGEFNITTDPDLGKQVLEDDILLPKLILIPSDLTHKAIATESIQSQILSHDSKLRRLFYEIVMQFAANYKKNKGFLNGPPVHDPLAVLALLPLYQYKNDLEFKFDRYDLKVIVEKGSDYGRVFLDKEDNETGLFIGTDLNVEVFWNIILAALEKADSVASINK